LLAKDRAADAAALLKACTEKAPRSPEGWLALIRLAMYQAAKTDNPAKRDELWKKAAEHIAQAENNLGDRVIVRMARGRLAVQSKDPRAIELLKKLGQKLDALSDVEKSQLWDGLATLAVQAKDLDLARTYCRLIAEAEPKNVRVRCVLCDLHFRAFEKGHPVDMQELDRLVDEIGRLGGQGPFWLYAKAIRALVQSQNKNPQLLLESRRYLRDAMEMRNGWSALAVLSGKVCELQEEPDQALEFYIRAIYSLNERDNDVIRRTAQLLVPRGRIDVAMQLFDYLEKQKSPMVDEMGQDYVYVKVFTSPVDEAEQLVDKSVVADSKNSKDLAWQGEMYACLTLRLKRAAQKAEAEKTGGSWRSNVAMLKVAQKGVNSLLRARQLNPQADDVWIALARLLVEVGQPDKARPLIPQAEHTLKSDKAPVTIALCWELLNEPVKAQETYEAAVKAAPQNCRVLRQVAGFYLRTGKTASAEPLLRTIISRQSPATLLDACWARRNLAILLRARGDSESRRKAIELLDENLGSKAASSDDKRLMDQFLADKPQG
jgi:tetratricopeptide (TPR) repeat protein